MKDVGMEFELVKKSLKVSIIIATYNSAKYLEQAIKSVLNQTYSNIELIIIDGLSTDNTLEIVKKYKSKLSYISEKDKGISDAFNKGVALSTGSFLYFLGSDDYLINPNVIKDIMRNVTCNDMLICGKIKRVDISGKTVLWTAPKSMKFNKYLLLYKMAIPHQGLFMNKKYFDEYGLFDINNKYSMDYELLLRSYKKFPKVIMKDIFVAAWRDGGIGADVTEEVFAEYHRIKIKNKVAPIVLLNIISKIIYLKYFIRKKLYE